MKQRSVIFLMVAVVIVLGAWFVSTRPGEEARAGELDLFAQCLKEKGVVMYGAKWCSHCENQKNAFGDSFRFIPYVECPEDPKLCLEKGIEGYPTWIFPDGRKLMGEQGPESLAKSSGCALPLKKGDSNQ